VSEFHALSGSYAINALDDIERAQFERHLSECAACQAEVSEFRETAALLSADALSAPPAGLRERLLAEISTVRPLPPQVERPQVTSLSSDRVGGHRGERRSPWTMLVAAAAAVVLLGAGGTVIWNQLGAEQTEVISATDQVLQAADAEEATVDLPGGAEATLVRSESLGQAVLITKALPEAPSGKAYQMWLLTDGTSPSSAGMMAAAADQTILLKGDAAKATAAAITIEPVGGSSQPTSQPIAIIDFSNLETT